ncbi:MAG: M10 family metallopeptidase C-terminal domain-containing protein [Pseudomonadota bacterium]
MNFIDITTGGSSAVPEPATDDIDTSIFASHIAACACCAHPSNLPSLANFNVANTNGRGGIQANFSPAESTVDDLADYLTVGYWSFATNGDWTDGAVWDVSGDRVLTYNVSMLSEAAADLARLAFDTWATVVNLTFVEQSGEADITFSDADEGAFSFFDAVRLTDEGTPHTIESAVVNISRRWLVTHGDDPDSFGFQTYLHEIGHALGLGHLGPYNAITTFEGNAIFDLDSWQMSVMSYFDQADAGVGTISEVRMPMLADIVALSRLYGAAENETGDTVYGFGATAMGDRFDATTGRSRDAYTIHDTGGIDTLDYSGFDQNQVIDLAPSGNSNVGGGRGNVLLSPDSVIERVVTGAGDDVIFATMETLSVDGGAGEDRLDFRTVTGGIKLDLEQTGALVVTNLEVIAGTAEDDVIAGDGANSVFIGRAGNDVIDGRGGADTVSYAEDLTAVSVNLGQNSATDGFGNTDTIRNVRHVTGSAFGDTIQGDNASNRLVGGLGDDFLLGGDGDDVLIAFGSDKDVPDFGNDVLWGGAGNDVLRLAGGTDQGRGGAGDDIIIATAFDVSDRFDLYGGAGNDTLIGSELGDGLRGGQGDDTIQAGRGEDFVSAGGGNDIVRGDQGADTISGSGGDDTLDGGAGHDFLFGGGDSDTLIGGAGNDLLNGGAGDDMIDGGNGKDTIRGAAGDDVADGGAGADILIGATGSDTLDGGEGDDTLIGGRDEDVLRGGSGADTLLGQGGNDILAGQAGADVLNGAGGDDRLEGGQSADILNGGAGADWLDGGSGNDRLSGQAGLDTFVFNAGDSGQNTVTDFTAGERLVLEGFGYGSRADARTDFTQSGGDVVFSGSGVTITFTGATLGEVLDGLIVTEDADALNGFA